MNTFQAGDERFERIELREDEFEAVVAQHEALFEGWVLAPWKPLLEGIGGRCRPDQVLISKAFDDWYVVEVELAHHPESHFRTQMRALAGASYGAHLVPSLENLVAAEHRGDLAALVRRTPPSFLCIADDVTERLRSSCHEFGFELCVLQPYRSTLGRMGLGVVKTPPALLYPERRAGRYPLELGDSMGGRRVAFLPTTFPNIKQAIVRHEGLLEEVRITGMGGRRFLFLPARWAQAEGNGLELFAVDPAREMYELAARGVNTR